MNKVCVSKFVTIRRIIVNYLAGPLNAYKWPFKTGEYLVNLIMPKGDRAMMDDAAMRIHECIGLAKNEINQNKQKYPIYSKWFDDEHVTMIGGWFVATDMYNAGKFCFGDKFPEFLSKFIRNDQSFKSITTFLTRLFFWMSEHGYYDVVMGIAVEVDEERMVAARQLLAKDMTAIIIKADPMLGTHEDVANGIMELL